MWIDDTGELLVAGNNSGFVTVWNIPQRKLLYSFKVDNKSRIQAARLSTDRSRLIAITNDLVKIFDVKSKLVVSSLKLPDNYEFFKDSIVGDVDFVVTHTVQKCNINQLIYISLKDPHKLIPIDEPLRCDQPSDDDDSEFFHSEARIFPIPSQAKIIVARYGDPEIKRWDLRTRRVECNDQVAPR